MTKNTAITESQVVMVADSVECTLKYGRFAFLRRMTCVKLLKCLWILLCIPKLCTRLLPFPVHLNIFSESLRKQNAKG